MTSVTRFSSLFTSLLAVFIVANLEKPDSNSYGLTPSDASWITWEEQVFERSLKDRVAQQILLYKTGLKTSYTNNLSGLIVHESKKYGYDPLLLTAVIITAVSYTHLTLPTILLV